MNAATILLVDDDDEIRAEMKTYLNANNINVIEARDGFSARSHMLQHPVDLIILDLALGTENGFDLLKEIRHSHVTPCIMVTAHNDDTDRVVGLELGADDYIAKPVKMRELLARIRSLLRRAKMSLGQEESVNAIETINCLSNSAWKFDPLRRELTASHGELVPLTTAECDLLIELVSHAGKPQARDDLCRRVFNREWQPYDRSLDSIIVKLRRKLEKNPDQPMVIKTVRGRGYVFTGFQNMD